MLILFRDEHVEKPHTAKGARAGATPTALGPGGTWGVHVPGTLDFSPWGMCTRVCSVIFGKIICFFCALRCVTFF